MNTDKTNATAGAEVNFLRQILGLVVVGALLAIPLWLTDLDLQVAGLFYQPDAQPAWPLGKAPLWLALYYGVPVLSAILVLGSLAALVLAMRNPRHSVLARPAIFLLATLIIGPGLLVNEVFKEHWGRPRPRQVEQFGGDMQYQPALVPNFGASGKSFASGHASVGFVLMTAWLLVPAARRRTAWLVFMAGVGLGTFFGVGRIVAGAHFLSDIVWSGLITYAAALLVLFIMRMRH
jgi:membrane-associated PAP2 superfamily phosphatase